MFPGLVDVSGLETERGDRHIIGTCNREKGVRANENKAARSTNTNARFITKNSLNLTQISRNRHFFGTSQNKEEILNATKKKLIIHASLHLRRCGHE